MSVFTTLFTSISTSPFGHAGLRKNTSFSSSLDYLDHSGLMWNNNPIGAILQLDQRCVSAGIHCTDPQVKSVFRTLCSIYIILWQTNGFVSPWTPWIQIQTLMDFSLQCEFDKVITSEWLEWYYEEWLKILIWSFIECHINTGRQSADNVSLTRYKCLTYTHKFTYTGDNLIRFWSLGAYEKKKKIHNN